MCGFTSYCNLAIVTTMWPESPNLREREVFENRETELRTNKAFFGDLIAQGARLFQHHEEGYGDTLSQATSARRIVEYLVQQSDIHTADALKIQRELVDEKKTLEQTAAGFVAAEHLHAARQEHEGELKKLRTDMTEALRSSDKEYALQLKDIKTEMEIKLQKAETDRQALTKTMADFHQTETEALERRIVDLNKRFAAEVKAKEQELQKMQASLNRLRLEVDHLSHQPQQKQLIARRTIEQQQAVESARRKAEKAREEQLQFDMYAQAMVNGLVNGLASGMTSGGVAALAGTGMCIMM